MHTTIRKAKRAVATIWRLLVAVAAATPTEHNDNPFYE